MAISIFLCLFFLFKCLRRFEGFPEIYTCLWFVFLGDLLIPWPPYKDRPSSGDSVSNPVPSGLATAQFGAFIPTSYKLHVNVGNDDYAN